MDPKEKDLTVQLLTEKLERITGKKVTFKECVTETEKPLTEEPEYAATDPDRDRKRVEDIISKSNGDIGKVQQLTRNMRASITDQSKVQARKVEALQGLNMEIRNNFKARAYLMIYRIFAGA